MKKITLFPSPCGVLVLKFVQRVTTWQTWYKKFPSPCGVLVLKYYDGNPHYGGRRSGFRPLAGFWFLNPIGMPCTKKTLLWFPSPCGVLVLKCAWKDTRAENAALVSVPLRGSGS